MALKTSVESENFSAKKLDGSESEKLEKIA